MSQTKEDTAVILRAVELGAKPDPSDPALFINRELSWLRFNGRVLEEAMSPSTPLLERVNFLSIFAGNLDEFFMVRVSGLRQQLKAGVLEAPPDGMTPAEQLQEIRESLLPLLELADGCWIEQLSPQLREAGIRVQSWQELDVAEQEALGARFESEIFPVLTPLAFDPGHPFPHISNLSVNLAVLLEDPGYGERFARLKVPANFPRLLAVPQLELESPEAVGPMGSGSRGFVLIEEVIVANLGLLFPGLEIIAAFPFRVTRDADLDLEEDEADDLLTAMAEVVGRRHFGSAIRLEINEAMPPRIRDILIENLELESHQVYATRSRIGLANISELCGLDAPELKYPPFLPAVPPQVASDANIFSAVARRDLLLYHPYDSFAPVVSFLRQAAQDPDVLAIKQTLYRVGPDSPVVEALMEARENNKQVSVLVELKARFDEESNIEWGRALEQAGVHVVYGVLGLKTHAKMCLVVRRERSGIRRYVHLSTGNYNVVTSRIYADLGFFTCDEAIAEDVALLFNTLTGYSRKQAYRKLLVAPSHMRGEILRRIDREIERHRAGGDGHIAFKVNSLVDRACIQSLYRASAEGVRIDLQVRGVCCLRPGVPGVSETIAVTSIVGRFLEHSRIYYFRNGGDEEVFVGSADLMPRNLNGRVELLFPIEDDRLLVEVRDAILFTHLRDSVKARVLEPDGSYSRVPDSDERSPDSQQALLERRARAAV
ncbi:MAG: polyphosphate kinase 1 [Acidobacteriota bacterium]|nr:polyphosphate kinase 1 [Acidobacteriota bacterium]